MLWRTSNIWIGVDILWKFQKMFMNSLKIPKEIRQHNGQKKKCKKTHNEVQNIYIKLKIE